MPGAQLAKLNAARRYLTRASSVADVKKVIALADGLLAAARKLSDKTAQIEAAELRFRAMRRLGQMINIQKRTVGLDKGGRPAKTGSKSNPVSKPLTLSQVGISKRLANDARQLSAMSESAFEDFLSGWRKRCEVAKKRVTTTLLRLPKPQQRGLFDPSHSYLAWNGRKLERVRLKNTSAPDWLKLAETTDSMIGMIVTTIKKLNKMALAVGDPKSSEKLQQAFNTLAADIERLSDQYWRIRNLLKEPKSSATHHTEIEYDAELERRGLWPAKKDDPEDLPF